MPKLAVVLVEPSPLGKHLPHRRHRVLTHPIDGSIVALVLLASLAVGVGMWSAMWTWDSRVGGYVRTSQMINKYVEER